MIVVDAQVHAWKDGESTGHHRRQPIDEAVLRQEMKDAGVDRAVLVPPLWDPNGNAYALQLAQRDPSTFAVMGLLDLQAPDAAQRLSEWREQPGMRGVRFLLNTPQRLQAWHEGLLDPLWSVAEDLRLPVALLVPGQLNIASAVARAHPRLPLIVDHLGVPRGAVGEAALRHWPELLALAEFPNVYVKAAGVGDYALDPFPFRSLQVPLRQVFDAFGSQRVVWASELSRLHCPYAQCREHFEQHLPFLSESQVAQVLGKNMLTLLDWA